MRCLSFQPPLHISGLDSIGKLQKLELSLVGLALPHLILLGIV